MATVESYRRELQERANSRAYEKELKGDSSRLYSVPLY